MPVKIISLKIRPIVLAAFALTAPVQAGEVTVVKAEIKCQEERCSAEVTLKHKDTGWKHYADHWRVLSLEGEELGRRVLAHPHVDEQPFTRGLYTLTVPTDMEYVLIEGHDSQHEYGGNRLKVKVER